MGLLQRKPARAFSHWMRMRSAARALVRMSILYLVLKSSQR